MRFERSSKLTGEITYLNFFAFTPDSGRDDVLWPLIDEVGKDLRAELERSVQQILGPAYELRDMHFNRGSVEMTAVLAVAGVVYVTLSQYRDFVDSVSLFVRQARAIIRRMLQRQVPPPVSVTGTWLPGPAMIPLMQAESAPNTRSDPLVSALVWYLILTHFAMLVLLALNSFR